MQEILRGLLSLCVTGVIIFLFLLLLGLLYGGRLPRNRSSAPLLLCPLFSPGIRWQVTGKGVVDVVG